MGFVLTTTTTKKNDKNSNVWKIQPVNMDGRRDMVLPLQMLNKATADRNSNHAAERLSASTTYCPVRGLVAREAFTPRQGGRSVTSHLPPRCQQALI